MQRALTTCMAFLALLFFTSRAVTEDDYELQATVQTPDIAFESDLDIGLWARFHFAIHTADFDATRAFYRVLGFTEGIGGFPLTNTHAMARALGMFEECQYELAKGEVLLFPGAENTTGIDLLQWHKPFNPEPPYQKPNHLGMAYATLLTTDLVADYTFLKSRDVEFLSEPYGAPGNRFVFMRDPDGIYLKLEESPIPNLNSVEQAGTHIMGMPYIGINVSDIDISIDFYRRFGYTNVRRISEQTLSAEESAAWGFASPIRFRGADIAINRGDHHRIRLLQWLEPFNPEPAYAPPINHKGINRLALTVPDVERAVAILRKQGVPFLSEIAPCCSGTDSDTGGIVHAIDPDGVFLELVGNLTPRPVPPQPAHCPPLQIRYPD
ncbi:MAG: VOC family protein [Luminiphilus sp.]|jgi:catechol 2,3-dioxygenase-like lactoylglutathione lyase family enzyme|nr:VOC family protein [Luminiphilus sp.]